MPCRSYHPYWEGKICVESLPVHSLTPVVMKESGTVREITGWAFVAGAKPVRVCYVIRGHYDKQPIREEDYVPCGTNEPIIPMTI